MLVLYDNAAGYAVFQVLDENKFKKAEDVAAFFANPESDPKAFYKLLAFNKFNDTKEALTAATNTMNGVANDTLKATLKKVYKKGMKETIAVCDTHIGQIIKEDLKMKDVPFIHGDYVLELMRGINAHITELLEGVTETDMNAMRLGLAHSISRYKLKFSPDKVDTMIVHAISLLDEIDKELNNYVMRMKEWYGWHFPELAKAVPDAVAYAKLVIKCGYRTKFVEFDLNKILDEDVEAEVKKLAEISMGTEISDEDITNISYLADQVVQITDYREKLNAYLRDRMCAIAPNLSNIVGELVGARLISHAGSLVNLAKHPASTVQILGAEKALFRALKTRKDTPKYGLIYHASIVSQVSAKNKGKVSRMLAAKASLACRTDALSDESSCEVSKIALEKLGRQLNRLEGTSVGALLAKTPVKQDKQTNSSKVVQYNPTDSTLPGAETKLSLVKAEPSLLVTDGTLQADETPKKDKKKKKKKSISVKEEPVSSGEAVAAEPETQSEKKKKKKKKSVEVKEEPIEMETEAVEPEAPKSEKKKKKKKKSLAAEAEVEVKVEVKEEPVEEPTTEKKKKKKRKLDETVETEGDSSMAESKKKKKKKAKKEE